MLARHQYPLHTVLAAFRCTLISHAPLSSGRAVARAAARASASHLGAAASARRSPFSSAAASRSADKNTPVGKDQSSSLSKDAVADSASAPSAPAASQSSSLAPKLSERPASVSTIIKGVPDRALAGVSEEYVKELSLRAEKGRDGRQVFWANPGSQGQLHRIPAEVVMALPPPRKPLWPEPPSALTWRYTRALAVTMIFVALAIYLQAKDRVKGSARLELERRFPWLTAALVKLNIIQDYGALVGSLDRAALFDRLFDKFAAITAAEESRSRTLQTTFAHARYIEEETARRREERRKARLHNNGSSSTTQEAVVASEGSSTASSSSSGSTGWLGWLLSWVWSAEGKKKQDQKKQENKKSKNWAQRKAEEMAAEKAAAAKVKVSPDALIPLSRAVALLEVLRGARMGAGLELTPEVLAGPRGIVVDDKSRLYTMSNAVHALLVADGVLSAPTTSTSDSDGSGKAAIRQVRSSSILRHVRGSAPPSVRDDVDVDVDSNGNSGRGVGVGLSAFGFLGEVIQEAVDQGLGAEKAMIIVETFRGNGNRDDTTPPPKPAFKVSPPVAAALKKAGTPMGPHGDGRGVSITHEQFLALLSEGCRELSDVVVLLSSSEALGVTAVTPEVRESLSELYDKLLAAQQAQQQAQAASVAATTPPAKEEAAKVSEAPSAALLQLLQVSADSLSEVASNIGFSGDMLRARRYADNALIRQGRMPPLEGDKTAFAPIKRSDFVDFMAEAASAAQIDGSRVKDYLRVFYMLHLSGIREAAGAGSAMA